MTLSQVQKQMSERDPLLQDHGDSGQQLQQGKDQKGVRHASALGPLEISRSTRYAILAGIWIATFLSVSLSVYSG